MNQIVYLRNEPTYQYQVILYDNCYINYNICFNIVQALTLSDKFLFYMT